MAAAAGKICSTGSQAVIMAAVAGSGKGINNADMADSYRRAGTQSCVMAADADVRGNGSGVATGVSANVAVYTDNRIYLVF